MTGGLLTRLILASPPRWGLPPLWFRGDRLPLLGGDLSFFGGDLSLLVGDRSRGLTGDLDEVNKGSDSPNQLNN